MYIDNCISVDPILRWAGSKRKLLPVLKPFAKNYCEHRYIEPFFGSGCLYFATEFKKATIGDLNLDIINLYESIKYAPKALFEELKKYDANKESYYFLRNKFNAEKNKLLRASLFLYLNRLSFNGIYRTNKKGEFNVPLGSRYGKMPNLKQILKISKRLENVQIMPGDFCNCLNDIGTGDFVYLDPPYDYTGRVDRGEYGEGSFQTKDLIRLSEGLKKINESGGTFLLSYIDVKDIHFLQEQWNYKRLEVKRQVASFASKRKTVTEILLTNKEII